MIITPRFRPIAPSSRVQVSLPVSGDTWYRAGELSNWLQAQGGMLVPWCAIGATIAAGTNKQLLFHLLARPRATDRLWLFWLEQTPGSTAAVEIALPEGGVYNPPAASMVAGSLRVAFVRETLASRASVAGLLQVSIAPTGNAVRVIAAACYELARSTSVVEGLPVGDGSSLSASADDHGVDLSTLRTDRPIIAQDYRSLKGVDDAYDAIAPHVRRWHYYWSAAVTDNATFGTDGLTTTSTSNVDVFPVPIKIQGTKVRPASTTRTVHVAIYARAVGGAGVIDVSSGSDTVALAVTSADVYEGDVDVLCTDLSDDFGGTLDALQISLRRTTGTSIQIVAIGIYEE